MCGQRIDVDDGCVRIDEGMARNGMEINLSDTGDQREFLFQYTMAESAGISCQQQCDAIVRGMSEKGRTKDPTDECEIKE